MNAIATVKAALTAAGGRRGAESDLDTDCGAAVKTPCISVDETESPLVAIARLVAHRRELENAIDAEVGRARAASRWGRNAWGVYGQPTWAELGEALGTSGQAANQRYGRKR